MLVLLLVIGEFIKLILFLFFSHDKQQVKLFRYGKMLKVFKKKKKINK